MSPDPTVACIVLAAGRGERFGDRKQFARAGGERLVDIVVATARDVAGAVVVVLPPGVGWDGDRAVTAATGGATRADSVRAGLEAVPATTEIVVVHDAAHPLATADLFMAVVGAVAAGADAAVPVLPLAESLKRVDGRRVTRTLPRDGLVLAQTPQAFAADVLRRVHAAGPDTVDDVAAVESTGTVVTVPGDPRNIHVTEPGDLEVVAAVRALPRPGRDH